MLSTANPDSCTPQHVTFGFDFLLEQASEIAPSTQKDTKQSPNEENLNKTKPYDEKTHGTHGTNDMIVEKTAKNGWPFLQNMPCSLYQ